MIEPAAFQFNHETALNNFYQKDNLSESNPQKKVLVEFYNFVKKLKINGIKVIVIKDTLEPAKPDAIFPNNWVSFHEDGTVILFPMWALNRRIERRSDLLTILQKENNFYIKNKKDFSHYEEKNKFLEGTGSIVLDRKNKLCYAAISIRTHKILVEKFCDEMNYLPVVFSAKQSVEGNRVPIYHTNVMMTIADNYAIICLESIDDFKEKELVVKTITESKKEIIEITETQKKCFAANSLQVMSDTNYLIMSSTAYHSLNKNQISRIEHYNTIIHSDLNTIENLGGGSARCMMAEIFLPIKH